MITLTHQSYEILIGENKEENDCLVKTSAPDDYWIHVADYSSAHGVILNPSGKRIPLTVIKKVCLAIKQKSNKCKSIQKLKFDVTKIKHLTPTTNTGEVIVETLLKEVRL